MSDPIIVLAIIIRVFSGIAAYLMVIRKLLQERSLMSDKHKLDNTMLIVSVTTFIISCFGTALFQACRVAIVPYCSSVAALDIVSLFNSLSLLSAFLVMYLIVHPIRKNDV